MRNLVWKELRQNGGVVLAAGITAAVPYVACLVIARIAPIVQPGSPGPGGAWLFWGNVFIQASMMSLALCVLLAAFVGGNAIAGERVDRSAEFAGYLPIPRGRGVAGKAVVSGGTCLGIWAINAGVLVAAWRIFAGGLGKPVGPHHVPQELAGAVFSLIGTLLMFGLAWLLSSVLSRPAIAAAGAIATLIALVLAVQGVCAVLGPEPERAFVKVCVFGLAPAIGVLTFAAGVVVCLRRAEA